MKQPNFNLIIVVLAMTACRPLSVTFFDAKANVAPYEQSVNQEISLLFHESIPENFLMVNESLEDIKVENFRKSLRISLYYAFTGSFENVVFEQKPGENTLSLRMEEVNPAWKPWKASGNNSEASEDDGKSNKGLYYMDISYKAKLYRADEVIKTWERSVTSELSASSKTEVTDVFKDAVKVMCEDVYKQVVEEVAG